MSEITPTEADRQFLLSRMHYYNHHPDFSQRFMDVFPIFTSPRATSIVIDSFLSYLKSTFNTSEEIGAIVGPEAEGFLLGPLLAARLGVPFVPARKKGKLPGEVLREEYQKWASRDCLEMQVGAFEEVERGKGVVIVDDSVASGGSAGGVKRLIERLGMRVLCGCFIFEADMPEHRETQRKHLGDLPLYAPLRVSEETLASMELFDGKKDENGEYGGGV